MCELALFARPHGMSRAKNAGKGKHNTQLSAYVPNNIEHRETVENGTRENERANLYRRVCVCEY